MPHQHVTLPATRPLLTTGSLTLVIALLAAFATAACTTPQRPGPDSAPATSQPPSDDRAAPPGYRPAYHLTPERHWMNDPQRPFYLDGRWHLYYLYNADHPHGNGTSWFHATSTDLVNWRDEGVAIEKYRNGLGDIQTGSAVVDTDNTAGFGHGAVIALVTQQDAGVQRQSLFYSTDGGYSFEPYAGNPVMDNPGALHWRDPKVVWDAARSQWVMVLAEGHKLGFYTSPDLKTWTYRSGFERDDLGLLECPDLFEMSVDGDPTRTTWVLATSANGAAYGRSANLAYWTGTWDGTSFSPAAEEPSWLDSGSDFYAAVTWDDPRADSDNRRATRYAIGWMNNWAYAGDLPIEGWAGGMLSAVREVTLTTIDGRPTLTSRPVQALTSLEANADGARTMSVSSEAPRRLHAGVTAYRLRARISRPADRPARAVRLHLSEEVTIGYDFAEGTAFLVRRQAGPGGLPPEYDQVRTAPATTEDGAVEFDVLVDSASVEAFVNGGERSFSALSFGSPAPSPLIVEAVDGTVRLSDASVVPLEPATSPGR